MGRSLIEERFGLEGRTAIVTGASSGIGARFVEVLAQAGANVVASARRLERLQTLAAGRDAVAAIACDVTVAEDRQRLIDQTVERFGRLDILINNAGVPGNAVAAEDETSEGFASVMATNLEASFALTALAYPHLAETQGTVINVSSILGSVAATPFKQASYCASKAGLLGLTRELAAQWGPMGVRVNALAPGWIDTEAIAPVLADERSRRWMERATPLGRIASVEELDTAVLFLASPASTFVTGTTITVDGGWTAR